MWERHGITEKQANEAVADVEALWFDPNPSSRSGRSLRVIGYSYSRRRVLTIILVRSETGRWYWGANGWEANSSTDVAMQGIFMGIENEIQSIQQESEATRDLPLPDEVVGERRGNSVVKSVRLPEAEYKEIEQLADKSGIPVSALIRGWILQGLAAERDLSLHGAIERVVGEADRLRGIARKDDVA